MRHVCFALALIALPASAATPKDDVCMALEQPGGKGQGEYLRLRKSGVADYANLDAAFPSRRVHGTWRRRGAEYELRLPGVVRDIESGELSVAVKTELNVPLVAEVRDLVEALLAGHPAQQEFTNEQLDLRATVLGCPDGTEEFCTPEGTRSVHVFVGFTETPITRAQVEALLHELDAYVAAPEHDVFHFTLDTYRSWHFATFRESHQYWNEERDQLHREIDSVLAGHDDDLPRVFRVVRCSALPPSAH